MHRVSERSGASVGSWWRWQCSTHSRLARAMRECPTKAELARFSEQERQWSTAGVALPSFPPLMNPTARNATILVLTSLFFLSGCATQVGKSGMQKIPPDAAQTCAGYCTQIGMRLTAVAIMAGNVGCVCEGATAAGHAEVQSSAVAGGMTAIEIAAEQQRQQQEQQRRANYSSSTY